MKTSCNRPDTKATSFGRGDKRLMKKRVISHEKKSIVVCQPEAHFLGPDAAQRTLNQYCIRSSKAYI